MRRVMFVLCLIACGDGGSTPDPDAPDPSRFEARVDFPDHTPASGIEVVFHDVDGEVLGTEQTNDEGIAVFEDERVAMMTVVSRTPDSQEIFTKVGVTAGDQPVFTLPFDPNTPPPPPPPAFSRDISITLPPNPPGGATQFTVDFLCASVTNAATTFSFTLLGDCRRPGTELIDVIALAKNGSDVVGFALRPDLTLATSGTTALDFPGGWRTDFRTFDVTYENVPAGTTRIGIAFQLRINGNAHRPAAFEAVDNPAGNLSRSYQFVNGIGSSIGPNVELTLADGTRLFYANSFAPLASQTFDLAQELLAPVSDLEVIDPGERPTIQWTQTASHDGASEGFVLMTSDTGNWTLQIPPDDATSVRIPALPDFMAPFRPGGTITATGVVFDFLSYAPTYSDALARRLPFDGDIFVESFMRHFPLAN